MNNIHSKISRKLLRQFFLIYSIIFILLALLALSVSSAYLFYSTRSSLAAGVSIVSDTLKTYWQNIQEKSWYLTSQEDLRTLIKRYQNDPTQENYQRVNLHLNSFQSADSSLLFVMLEDHNGTVFRSINYAGSGIQTYIQNQDIYQSFRTQHGSYRSPILTEGFADRTLPYCYYLTTHSLNGQDCLITLCYDAEGLVKNLETGSRDMDSLVIYENSGQCLYHSDDQTTVPELPGFVQSATTSACGSLNQNGYQYSQMDYSFSTYTVGTITLRHLMGNLFLIAAILFIIYIIPLVAVLFYIIPINDRLLKPLGELTREISDFSIGKAPVQIYHTNDEIEDLSRSFQQMSVNINHQAEELTQKEREKAVTYYKLLTTQLDPHFIYNTMNIINILARRKAFEDIIKVNTALTKVIRERLNTQNSAFGEISDEIRTLQQYQLIMDYRYHNMVQVDYDIDPSVMTRKIPKNILQPLVENAYYHGLTRDDGAIAGNIGILVYPLEEELVIEISDDGQGISAAHLKDVKAMLHSSAQPPEEEAHIGMANIYNRIRYLYGNHFSMDVQSQEGHGTTIVISLPLDPPRKL